MSRSLRRDDGFYMRGKSSMFSVEATKPKAEPGRRCVTCDTILSIYNDDDYCAPCQRKAFHRHIWRYGACPVCGIPLIKVRQTYCSRVCMDNAAADRIRYDYLTSSCQVSSPSGERCIKAPDHHRRHSWERRSA